MQDFIINNLKKDIVIPKVVLSKTEDTLKTIKKQNKGSKVKECGVKNISKMAASIAIGVLTCGVITAGAAVYIKWSKGLEKELQITDQQKIEAEESGLADFVNQSVTKGEITITAEQSIVDNYFAYLSFRIEGYDISEKDEPAFQSLDITVGNNKKVGSNSKFYNEKDFSYILEDGSLEYHILLYSDGEKDLFLNQPIAVKFAGLGLYDDNLNITTKVDETWKFNWILKGTDSNFKNLCDIPVSGTDAILKEVEISPISIRTVLEFPKQDEMESVSNQYARDKKQYRDIPHIYGIKLKDGTIYQSVTSGGEEKYINYNEYEMLFATTHIIDINQIESILFTISYSDGEEPKMENLTEVKIN